MAKDYSNIQGGDFYHVAKRDDSTDLAGGIAKGLEAFAKIRKGMSDSKKATQEKDRLRQLEGRKEQRAQEEHESKIALRDLQGKALTGKSSPSSKSKSSGSSSRFTGSTGFTPQQANAMLEKINKQIADLEINDDALSEAEASFQQDPEDNTPYSRLHKLKNYDTHKGLVAERDRIRAIYDQTMSDYEASRSGEGQQASTTKKTESPSSEHKTVAPEVDGEAKKPSLLERMKSQKTMTNANDSTNTLGDRAPTNAMLSTGITEAESTAGRLLGELGGSAPVKYAKELPSRLAESITEPVSDLMEAGSQWARLQSSDVNSLVNENAPDSEAQGIKNILSNLASNPDQLKQLYDSIDDNMQSQYLSAEGVDVVIDAMNNSGQRETPSSESRSIMGKLRHGTMIDAPSGAPNQAMEAAVEDALSDPEGNRELIEELLSMEDLPLDYRKELERAIGKDSKKSFMDGVLTSGRQDKPVNLMGKKGRLPVEVLPSR